MALSSVGTIKQSEAYVGDRLGMYMFLIRSNVYVFVFVIAALLFGITNIIVGLYMKSARVHERCDALLSLGAYILLTGVWIVTDSNLLVIFTKRTGLVELISFLAFYGLPVALLGFTEKMLPSNKRMFRMLQNIFIVLLLMYSINYIWKLVPLVVMIGAEHTRMAFQNMMKELGNRAAFLEEQKLVAGHRGSFAYIMIDANNLKKINDTLGHQKGDELLIGIAECIRAGVGGRGNCYRIGGDEFVVSLKDVTEEEVRQCMAYIQAEVESADRQSDIEISAAMGYAWTASMDQNVEELLEQADGAMYENKIAMKQRREDM